MMSDLPESIGCWLGTTTFIIGFLLCILMLGGVAYILIFGLFSSTGKSAIFFANVCMSAIIAFLPGLIVAHNLRMFEFRLLSERAKPLIAAIHRYEKEFGHPPEDLEDLVPKFFRKVPRTGIYANPEYHFRRLEGEEDAWELAVSCSGGPLNWDEFFYRPSEKYGERAGGGVEPMGTWAYFHE